MIKLYWLFFELRDWQEGVGNSVHNDSRNPFLSPDCHWICVIHVLRWSLICLIKHWGLQNKLQAVYICMIKSLYRVDEYSRLNFKLLEFKSCLCLSHCLSSQPLKIGQPSLAGMVCYLGCRRNVRFVWEKKLFVVRANWFYKALLTCWTVQC